jgi:uncharacterized membrane protein YphA (DoxX/SURF4 family)
VADRAEEIVTPGFPAWSLLHRIVFRFFCLYWVLWLSSIWKPVAPFVATRLFHVSAEAATYHRTGSGDTTLQYVGVFLSFVGALSGTAIWSILDRRRDQYVLLHSWLRVLIRYFMALMLMSYGYSKVFLLQFSENLPSRLGQEYGTFSPMGVVWSFMGASAAYTIFSGLAEVTGGVLLYFRRTTALGALVTFGVMTNVVALNYCYDIPVKIHSTHYLVMSAFLLAPDFRRLVNVFVLNRAAEAGELRFPEFRPGWRLWTSRVAWIALFGLGVIAQGVDAYKQYVAPKPRSPLYGLYTVESETPEGWQSLAFDRPNNATLRARNGRWGYLRADYDVAKQMVTIEKLGPYRWSQQDGKILLLTGTPPGGNKEMMIRLRRYDETLPLRTRGFHWVQEYPFNR